MPQDASAIEREAYDRVLFLGNPHVGKMLPDSEPVLTPAGWKPMGRLTVGEFVIGSDGRPTKVIAVYPHGRKPIVSLTTDCGATARCGLEHLWFTTTRHELKRGAWRYPPGTPHHMRKGLVREFVGWGEGSVKTTQELIETLDACHYMPRVAPVVYEHVEPPLDPYFLGLLLGDGSMSDGNQVTLERGVSSLGDVPIRCDAGKCPYVRVNGSNLKRALNELGLYGARSSTKFVPDIFLRASPQARLALLRGLCDTDGHAVRMSTAYNVDHEHNGMSLMAEFSTTSKRLCDGVIELVRSLGGRAATRYRPEPYSQSGPGQPAWIVCISFEDDTCPFLLSRKADLWVGGGREKLYRQRIEKIEPAGEETCTCITVDAEDGLFVVNDYLLTHNSTSIVASAALALGPGYVINCGKKQGLIAAVRRGAKFKWDSVRDEAQMEDALKEARRGCKEGAYKWLVIDDYNLYGSWLEVALEDMTRNSKGESDGRRFWREYKKRLLNILIRCFDFKAHVYVICHYIEIDGIIEGQTEKYGPDIVPLFAGAARKEIPALFPDTVFMAPSSKDPTKRSFYINPVGVFGPTCLSLPETHEIDADVGVLHEAFVKGVGKPAPKASKAPR
jgi:hypothetical protein